MIFITLLFLIKNSYALIKLHIYQDASVCQMPLIKSSVINDKPKTCIRDFDDFEKDYCLQKHATISNSNHCYVHSIFAEMSDMREAFKHLSASEVDSNSTVQAIKITFYQTSNSPGIMSIASISDLGESLDEFLIPRPWWRVVYEPYSWVKSHPLPHIENIKEKNPHEMRHTLLANNQIMLKRVDQRQEPYLKYISKLQYPSEYMCSISPLMYGFQGCGHPGIIIFIF